MKTIRLLFSVFMSMAMFVSTHAVAGEQWFRMPLGSAPELHGVWAAAADDVFAVGNNGVILHYNGRSWSGMTSGVSSALRGVWGASGSDVLAVGDNGVILRYNGTGWTDMESGVTSALHGVWGLSSDDIFAVGDNGVILRFDGGTWSEIDSGATSALYDVWAASGSDVYVVGDSGLIVHYDGVSWSTVDGGFRRERMVGVWGASGSDVFAAAETMVRHYDGTEWNHRHGSYICPASVCTNLYFDVWGSSVNNVFVVGFSFVPSWADPRDGPTSAHVVHLDGDSWSYLERGLSNTTLLNSVWGVSENDVFAVGREGMNGVIYRYGASVGGVENVPTLNEWGMIFLSLLIVASASRVIKRRTHRTGL